LIHHAPGELKLKKENRRHRRPHNQPGPSRANDRAWKGREEREEDGSDRETAHERNPEREPDDRGQRAPPGGDLIGPDDGKYGERGEHPRAHSSRSIGWTPERENQRQHQRGELHASRAQQRRPGCRYPVARWRPTEDQDDDRLMARGSIHFQPKRLAGAEIHFDRQPVESTSYGM